MSGKTRLREELARERARRTRTAARPHLFPHDTGAPSKRRPQAEKSELEGPAGVRNRQVLLRPTELLQRTTKP
jgi:hypothetical protein